MKKLTIALLLIGALSAPIVAQPNYVAWPSSSLATATGTGTNSWPFSFSSTTGRFQQFLDGTLLPAGPLKIVNIALSASSGVQFSCTGDFQMRMSNTPTLSSPSSMFASNQVPCPTNLIERTNGYTYTPVGTAQWSDFNPDATFGWDGKSNICVEIRYRGKTSSIRNHSDTSIPRAWSNVTSIDNYSAATGNFAATTLGLVCRLEYVTDHICITDATTRIGSASNVALAGFTPGETYIIAASLGQTPFPVPSAGCSLALDLDGVFKASQTVGAPIFTNYVGVVGPSGFATAQFAPPAIPALAGLCVYHAAIGINTSVVNCTNTSGTQLVP